MCPTAHSLFLDLPPGKHCVSNLRTREREEEIISFDFRANIYPSEQIDRSKLTILFPDKK